MKLNFLILEYYAQWRTYFSPNQPHCKFVTGKVVVSYWVVFCCRCVFCCKYFVVHICMYIYIYIYIYICIYRLFATTVSQLKIGDFSGENFKSFRCYHILLVQRIHNCSSAASLTNCIMTLYLLKVHLQTFLSIPITQKKKQILSCDTFCRKWAAYWCIKLALSTL